jgi:hypothetical protein
MTLMAIHQELSWNEIKQEPMRRGKKRNPVKR